MSTNRHHDVRAFHRRFGHAVAEKPAVPDDETMRFRLKLIAEEFLETLDACGVDVATLNVDNLLRHSIESSGLKVDLPALVDALGDLDYVIEGTRAVCGVDGAPIHNAIHLANMAKDPVYVATKDEYHRQPDPKAKPTKPDDWTPPDIDVELRRQGWTG